MARICVADLRPRAFVASSPVLVYAVVDDSLSPSSPLGDSVEVVIRREDAERFIEEVRSDDPRWRRICGSRSGSYMRAG